MRHYLKFNGLQVRKIFYEDPASLAARVGRKQWRECSDPRHLEAIREFLTTHFEGGAAIEYDTQTRMPIRAIYEFPGQVAMRGQNGTRERILNEVQTYFGTRSGEFRPRDHPCEK